MRKASAGFAVLVCGVLGALLLLATGSWEWRLGDPPPAADSLEAATAPDADVAPSPTGEAELADPADAEAFEQADLEALDDPVAPWVHSTDDIEEIKRQIYERQIDSIDRIHLLDEIVQTGDADTREFWGKRWSGVDDWKRTGNGFDLRMNDDGTLLFFPDPETARTYTFFENIEVYHYDEERREFVSEVDYYGKPIYNVVKFIRPDALVLMTISGPKVDLNIYEKSGE